MGTDPMAYVIASESSSEAIQQHQQLDRFGPQKALAMTIVATVGH